MAGGGLFQVGLRDVAKLRRGPAKRNGQPKGAKSETSLHWHVAGLLKKHLADPAWFTTFPAGGGGEMRGKILKGLGLKSGVPDILIVVPMTLPILQADGSVQYVMVQLLYWIELKKLKKGVLSDAQIATQQQLTAMGCRVANCDNLEQVKACIGEWGLPHRATTPTEDKLQSALINSFANV